MSHAGTKHASDTSEEVQTEHENEGRLKATGASLGANCALAANQSVDCRATILFTISLSVKQGIQLACIRCRNTQEIS